MSTNRSITVDRGPPGGGPPLGGGATEPLEVGTIGPNRSVLPDGSVLCRNVPIARTGWLQYAPGEVPLEPSKQPLAAPIIYVHRGPEDLFNETTMRSFVGVAITHEHPPVKMTPSNFAHLGKGFVLNTYRGDGPDADCLMADLIVKDKWTIDFWGLDRPGTVNCEVSCGYEASYVQTGEGQGKQVDLIGNHLALVEKGRCGPRCAIGDEDTLSSTHVNEDLMTTPEKTGGAPGKQARIPLAERIARVIEEDGEQNENNGVHVHVHMGAAQTTDGAPGATTGKEGDDETKTTTLDAAVEERFTKIEAAQEETKTLLQGILTAVKEGKPAPTVPAAGSEDPEVVTEATATMDSAPLATSYQQLLSQAEILVPGFKLPTFDAAAQRKLTVDRMCQARRLVLGALSANAEGTALLASVNNGQPFDVLGATCPDVAVAFKAAATAKAASNNRSTTGDAAKLPQQQQSQAPARKSFAEINAENKKFWAGQTPRA